MAPHAGAWRPLRTHDRLLLAYRIRSVALYLSRHGVLVRWSVDELAARMLAHLRTGGSGPAAAREEFLALVGRLAAAEGAILDR